MDPEQVEINEDFVACFSEIENTDSCIFITGRAGTGKSTLLNYWKKRTLKKHVILAPTGIAALNVGGQTIHSFFRFPPKILSPKDIKKRKFAKIYQKLDMIVIDEISMVRVDLMAQIDLFLRINRNSDQPFGGVQMVFFGDLFQLPPVISSAEEHTYLLQNYESPYFFSAPVFLEEISINMIELTKVYRQESRRFLRLLDAVRLKRMDYDDLSDINERFEAQPNEAYNYITLSARNREVDRINAQELEQLNIEPYSFIAKIEGNIQAFPAESPLVLKKGAQVMFLKNNSIKKYYNGMIGKVKEVGPDQVIVEVMDEKGQYRNIKVEPEQWEAIKYELNEKNEIVTQKTGVYSQYPLRLAWAITIHKSQGKTFDRVIIDMGKGAFEYGQTYVALSRCRTLDGIILKQALKPSDILVDERILDFYQSNY